MFSQPLLSEFLDLSADDLANLMTRVSLSPKTPVRFLAQRSKFLAYLPFSGSRPATKDTVVPRKRSREEAEVSSDTSSVDGSGELF